MTAFEEMYRQKCMTADQALELIKDGDCMISAQAGGEPVAILSHLQHLKEIGIKNTRLVTSLPLQDYQAFHDPEMLGVMHNTSWFFSGGLRAAHKDKLSSPIPQHSTTSLPKVLKRAKAGGHRTVVLATVAPMDAHGYMSLSISAIYERDAIDAGAIPILEVNPNFPRTLGDTQIHISEAAAIVESDRPIPIAKIAPYTDVDATIGRNIAELIEDGSTIQLGIGNIPNAVAHELRNKKHLGIHTEMFTETMVDLIECGAVDNSQKGLHNGYSVCSFTIGTQRLYDYIDNNPSVMFKPCAYTNDPYTIGLNNKFVSINASLEIDLTGQCASETVGTTHWSGTGGQAETVQGAQMSPGGKSIIAMHSTFKTKDKDGNEQLHSKIVPILQPGSVVSTSRNDTDYVVTEYGVAWLCGLSVDDRVKELIKIAHPQFREWLAAEAERLGIW